MQPLKQVLYQIDESGSGRMSYHDFYVSLYDPFFKSKPSTQHTIGHNLPASMRLNLSLHAQSA